MEKTNEKLRKIDALKQKLRADDQLDFIARLEKHLAGLDPGYMQNPDLLQLYEKLLSWLAAGPYKNNSHFLEKTYKEIRDQLQPIFYPGVDNSRTGMARWDYLFQFIELMPLDQFYRKLMGCRNIWSIPQLGNLFGLRLLNHHAALKKQIEASLCAAFDDPTMLAECLQQIYPGEEIAREQVPEFISRSLQFSNTEAARSDRGELSEAVFTDTLNRLKIPNRSRPGKPFSTDTPQHAGEVKIEFFKYLWLHWLECCFSDIFSLIICDAPTLFAVVHDDKFFVRQSTGTAFGARYTSERELIDNFFNLDSRYPLYFRYRFMLNALDEIEKAIDRKYPQAQKIDAHFKPSIERLLENNLISGDQKSSYRFYDHNKQRESFSISVELVDKMPRFIVRTIFQGVDDYLQKTNPSAAPQWLWQLCFQNWELEVVDDLIFKIVYEEKALTFYQYRHLLSAVRFALELYPRKVKLVNQLGLNGKKIPAPPGTNAQGRELVCIDYYFNREHYWDWAFFSKELQETLLSRGDETLAGLAARVKENYKDERQYDVIFEAIQESHQEALEQDRDFRKKITLMLNHYSAFREVLQYNRSLEEDVISGWIESQYQSAVLASIFTNNNFHLVLDRIVRTNIIQTDFLEVIEKSLYVLTADEFKKLPDVLTGNYHDSFYKRNSTDPLNLWLFHRSGYLFNRERYRKAVVNWYENRGNTHRIHQEAFKGKIIARIIARIFQLLQAELFAGRKTSEEEEISVHIERGFKIIRNGHIKKPDEFDTILAAVDRFFIKRIKNSPTAEKNYAKVIKDAVKEIGYETMCWIHFKNIHYMHERVLNIKIQTHRFINQDFCVRNKNNGIDGRRLTASAGNFKSAATFR